MVMSNPLWVANTRLKLQGVSVGTNAKCQCSSRRQLPTHTGIVGMSVGSLHAVIIIILRPFCYVTIQVLSIFPSFYLALYMFVLYELQPQT